MPLSTYQREDDPSVLTEDLIANEDLGGIKKFLHLIRQERYHIKRTLRLFFQEQLRRGLSHELQEISVRHSDLQS